MDYVDLPVSDISWHEPHTHAIRFQVWVAVAPHRWQIFHAVHQTRFLLTTGSLMDPLASLDTLEEAMRLASRLQYVLDTK